MQWSSQHDNVCRLLIACVENTDMSYHLKTISAVSSHIKSSRPDLSAVAPWSDAQFRMAAMSLVLHTADVSAGARPERLAGMWCMAIYEEFFRQGSLQVAAHMEITPFFQRNKVVISQAQVCPAASRMLVPNMAKVNLHIHQCVI